ncbi:KR domain-containing protein [Astrocystis sublimbata]|nr:KR domain-containing protein [Astrocystis sublimbata]
MACFVKNVSFSGVDLRHISIDRFDLARRIFRQTIRLMQDRIINYPKPCHIYPVLAIEDAFRYLQSGKNTGRIVISVQHSDKVQKRLLRHSRWNLDPNSTYLIAGRLGGVGRAILKWMAAKGARQMIVPSRSGAASEMAIETIRELVEQGVKIVTPKCDISCHASVQAMIDEYGGTMGPVRGCINAAMMLQDSIFDNMTREQWDATIRSKVQSSWNLHFLLPRNLDFFILLSSASGIVGNAGQSNYAAGCTFQDSLARFRVDQGQKAVSIDLGPIRTIGYLAENQGMPKSFQKHLGLPQIEEEEFLTFLEICCDPDLRPYTDSTCSHVTMGISTPSDLSLQGIEAPLQHLQKSLFAYFNKTNAASNGALQANQMESTNLFRQANTAEEATKVVVESLVGKLARALSIQSDDVDTDKPLHRYGVEYLYPETPISKAL